MKKWLALAATLPLCPAAFADNALPFGDSDACSDGPMQQFGRYIGDWVIEDEQLSKDGAEWLPGDGARWVFVCLGNGTANQRHQVIGYASRCHIETTGHVCLGKSRLL